MFNNINTQNLLETIKNECRIINSIDTTTQEGKDAVERRYWELELILNENWSDGVQEWIYG